jgi:hypothetical protein
MSLNKTIEHKILHKPFFSNTKEKETNLISQKHNS